MMPGSVWDDDAWDPDTWDLEAWAAAEDEPPAHQGYIALPGEYEPHIALPGVLG